MNKEFFIALDLLEKEKGIPKEYMLEKIEAALLSAVKKEYGNSALMRVAIDPVKEDIKVYQQKEVVEEVTNPQCQISLEDTKALSRRNTLG
ncbi:MAG: transcription termination/antitermination protein NusA, partial [Clostridia bacterium]|nr:transcription termination/antitermination protein NusA [Clostridia bacterium]